MRVTIVSGTNHEAERTLRSPAQARGTRRTNKTVTGARRQTGMTWSQGELTGSSTVDVNDLTIVLTNYNTTYAASPGIRVVPEPSQGERTTASCGWCVARTMHCFADTKIGTVPPRRRPLSRVLGEGGVRQRHIGAYLLCR